MTGYSGNAEEDRDFAIREAEHEPPIEMVLTDEELAERDRDFEQIAEQLERERQVPMMSLALNAADSSALRAKVVLMTEAIETFILESALYSQEVGRMLAAGDGDALIRFMFEQRERRTKQVHALESSLMVEWRVALLTSPGMTPENLAHWLPEYADQLLVNVAIATESSDENA